FSADVLILIAAILAATLVPENVWLLFGSILFGCYFSAMCAYWLGRLLGKQLPRIRLFSKLLSEKRLSNIKRFYERFGIWSLILGRFIPFGVRNCIFMSSGMSKLPFGRFILCDALACTIWCSSAFFLFYTLGQNFQAVWDALKTFNLVVFGAFGLAVIGFIWYKSSKKSQTAKAPSTPNSGEG
ncbi:MAG: DedA family protein, partial [Chlamydiota bacterium]